MTRADDHTLRSIDYAVCTYVSAFAVIHCSSELPRLAKGESLTRFVPFLARLFERIKEIVDDDHCVEVDGVKTPIALVHPVLDLLPAIPIAIGERGGCVKRLIVTHLFLFLS